jgi:hypothetical protein
MATLEETLAEVDRRITEDGLRLVAARNELAVLKSQGIATDQMEQSIVLLAETLDTMIEYRQLLMASLNHGSH